MENLGPSVPGEGLDPRDDEPTDLPMIGAGTHPDIHCVGAPEQRSALWLHLGKARVRFEKVTKSIEGQTGQQKFKYASFAQLTAAMVEPLAEEGLTIMQMITTPSSAYSCITTLLAGHGAELWVVIRFSPTENDHGFQATIKDFGAATTYYKRYQLQALGLIEGDRDADQIAEDMPGPQHRGNSAVKAQPPRQAAPALREIVPGVVDEQMAEIRALATQLGWKQAQGKARTMALFGKSLDPDQLTKEQAAVMIGTMKKDLEERGAK